MATTVTSTATNIPDDPFSYIGRKLIESYLTNVRKKINIAGIPPIPGPISATGYDIHFYGSTRPVGILGAGIGGLYTALILDSLGINYEILEASDRSGGRLKTHRFDGGDDYDYFDIGAMRFPLPMKDSNGDYKMGINRRLGQLINYEKLNQGEDRLKDKLLPYYFSAKTGDGLQPAILYFNGRRTRKTGTPDDSASGAEDLGIDAAYVNVGTGAIMEDALVRFSNGIATDIKKGDHKGWDALQMYDKYSTRAYMSLVYIPSADLPIPPMPLNTNVVNWCETFEDSSGSFDKAWSEAVLESLAFGGGTNILGDVEWKCFKGGSQTLSDSLERYLQSKEQYIHFNKKATSIGYFEHIIPVCPESPWQVDLQKGIKVGFEDGTESDYSHVISTLPLPTLRMIDLTKAELKVQQSTALRMLQYGPSIKIGMRFKEAWWTTKLNIVGGQSSTDLPIRTIVYPSYGVDSDTPSTTLIVSYCWTSDAERWGALINMSDPSAISEQLKTVVLRNLAEVHDPAIVSYEYLLDQCLETYAWDWNGSQYTMGAFAYFGPGNFGDMYRALTQPAGNHRIHFAGELISTRHAWVVGALDSAWRAVKEYLITSGQWEQHKETFTNLWGTNLEWTRSTKSDPSSFKSFPTKIELGTETYNIPKGETDTRDGEISANRNPDDDDLSDLMLEYIGFTDLFPGYL